LGARLIRPVDRNAAAAADDLAMLFFVEREVFCEKWKEEVENGFHPEIKMILPL
jgi:hypothetical protein